MKRAVHGLFGVGVCVGELDVSGMWVEVHGPFWTASCGQPACIGDGLLLPVETGPMTWV